MKNVHSYLQDSDDGLGVRQSTKSNALLEIILHNISTILSCNDKKMVVGGIIEIERKKHLKIG